MTPRSKGGVHLYVFTPYFGILILLTRRNVLATTIYDIAEIELEDGRSITIKPLPIKLLKKFMIIIRELDKEDIKTEEDAMDVFIKAAMVCLEKTSPDLSSDREAFEENVNVPTMMKILEVCGGLKMNDPNLLGAALVGTN